MGLATPVNDFAGGAARLPQEEAAGKLGGSREIATADAEPAALPAWFHPPLALPPLLLTPHLPAKQELPDDDDIAAEEEEGDDDCSRQQGGREERGGVEASPSDDKSGKNNNNNNNDESDKDNKSPRNLDEDADEDVDEDIDEDIDEEEEEIVEEDVTVGDVDDDMDIDMEAAFPFLPARFAAGLAEHLASAAAGGGGGGVGAGAAGARLAGLEQLAGAGLLDPRHIIHMLARKVGPKEKK